MKRRTFLRHLGLAGAGLGLARLPLALAMDTPALPDYRALICIFLYGGADTHNLLIPTDAEPWQTYRQRRAVLALDKGSLLPLAGTDDAGMAFALHPGCERIQSLFAAGELSFIRNVGALARPLSLNEARQQPGRLPALLFSHADQQIHWMRGEALRQQASGWGGRLREMLEADWPDSPIAPAFSLGFANPWQTGDHTSPFILGSQGVSTLVETYDPNHTDTLHARLQALLQAAEKNVQRPLQQQYATRLDSALANSRQLAALLERQVPLETTFPDTPFGRNLAMVARLIDLRESLGHTRQLFFVPLPGWDTHDRQLQEYPNLVQTLSEGMGALSDALKGLGVFDAVTTFTASDFGRTLTSNGDGSDHGWGTHQMVMGGALTGSGFQGRFPNLAANGPDDFGYGRMLPSTATQQYQATLARWFGLPESRLVELFPDLAHFDSPTLPFLPA